MKKPLRFLVGLCLLGVTSLHAGRVKVTLTPEEALSSGAHWRVDNGPWMESGSTTSNLSPGSHAVEFATVPGWIAPAPLEVAVTADETTNTTGVYVQSASFRLALMPASAQWKLDEGAWMASGAVVTNVAPGNHTVSYQGVLGYQIPSNEIVNLSAGQTLTWMRNYVQLAQLKMTLLPPYARWRVDGGIWRDGGATATDLAPGSHTIEYANVSGFASPRDETVSLAPGEVLSHQRNYTQLAQIAVILNPGNAWWRIDGGSWQSSGATVSNFVPGSHVLSYSHVNRYDPLPEEVILLGEGQSVTLSRNYFRHGP